jgi:hypothetical protein
LSILFFSRSILFFLSMSYAFWLCNLIM